jgi:hypothetical protein
MRFLFLLVFWVQTIELLAQHPVFDAANTGMGLASHGLLDKLSKEPITTSFADCDTSRFLSDTFGDTVSCANLFDQPRTIKGDFMLCAGFYKASVMSFCIRPGTYGPSHGDAYLYAPLKGPRADLMIKILERWKDKPELTQQQIQSLFWAIIAKARFSEMNPQMQHVAVSLLTAKELVEIGGGGLNVIPRPVMENLLLKLPEGLRDIYRSENLLREAFSLPNSTFEQLERIAMRPGAAQVSSQFQRGRWTYHPSGCYVRYLPEHYSKTALQIYVPEQDPSAPEPPIPIGTFTIPDCKIIIFNAIGTVAVPANTGAQRLLQTHFPIVSKN